MLIILCLQVPGLQSAAGPVQQQNPEQQQEQQQQQPQQQTAKRRVRKRRAPDAAELVPGPEQADGQQLGWGGSKRRRSTHHRAARDAAQLSNSIHSMLQPSSAPGSPSVVSQPAAAAVAAPAGPLGTDRSSRPGPPGARAPDKQRSRLQRISQEAPAAPATEAVPVPAATEAAAACVVQPVVTDVKHNPSDPAPGAAVSAVQKVSAVGPLASCAAEQAARLAEQQQVQEQQQQQIRSQHEHLSEPALTQQRHEERHTQEHQAKPAPAQQPAAPAVEPAAPAAAAEVAVAVEQVQKPASPPSETSHQQHIAPQHMQQLLPSNEQPLVQQQLQQPEALSPAPDMLQPAAQQQQPLVEQTAVSRDRSQCSLQRADAVRGTAAVNMPAPMAVPATPAAVTSAGEAATAGRLLELAPGAMTPAARALASLAAVPEVKQRCLPPEGVGRTQEEALQYLGSMMGKAKQLKYQGDKRHGMIGAWDVFGLSFYALSTVEFLLYWDTALRLLDRLKKSNQPADKLQQQVNSLSNAQFLRQTGALSTTGMNYCSNCKGPDVAKQALRMLLERLSAISNMRNLHNQRKQLEGHVRLLKTNGSSLGNGSSSSTARLQQQQQQQQTQQGRLHVQAQRAAAAAAVGKPPSPGGSSWSPAGQQAFNKRSPDDSNASNQERVQLAVPGDQGAAAVGAAGAAVGSAAGLQAERALHLAKSERQLMDTMQELLRMTDGMHQTVMRMQQFLESPDVLASEHARAAALHISVLGLDAGMFSIPRVAAHTEAAVMCITKLLRSS